MKKFHLFFIIALVAMMVSCNKEEEQTTAQAQTTEDKEAMENPQAARLQKVRLGQELALYGYENESAEALIEAANILADVQSEQIRGEKTQADEVADQGEKTTPERSFAPADLLAKAKELAGDDANLLAMIQRVEEKLAASAEGERGSTLTGNHTDVDNCPARGWTQYTVEFRGGELAECAVVGDGDTDLDLYVYDQNGHLITSDTDYSDRCYCSWTPRWTGNFVLRVINRGNVYNRFAIAVN